MTAHPPLPQIDKVPLWHSLLRIVARLVVLAAAIWAVSMLTGWVMAQSGGPDGMSMVGAGVLVLILLAYALLIAVPFVPGIEIALGLILLQGPPVVPYVYLATVTGLLIAYGIGRYLPEASLYRLLVDLRLRRACALHSRMVTLSATQRRDALSAWLPPMLKPLASGYRYLALGLAINIPGNSVVGGGGGLAMVAGISRLFDGPATALTILLAVAPVPLFVWVTGTTLF